MAEKVLKPEASKMMSDKMADKKKKSKEKVLTPEATKMLQEKFSSEKKKIKKAREVLNLP